MSDGENSKCEAGASWPPRVTSADRGSKRPEVNGLLRILSGSGDGGSETVVDSAPGVTCGGDGSSCKAEMSGMTHTLQGGGSDENDAEAN